MSSRNTTSEERGEPKWNGTEVPLRAYQPKRLTARPSWVPTAMPTTVKHETDQVFIALLGRQRRLWDPVSAKNINKRNDVILRQLNRRSRTWPRTDTIKNRSAASSPRRAFRQIDEAAPRAALSPHPSCIISVCYTVKNVVTSIIL